MATKPLLSTEQHCGYCGKTTEHKVTLEHGFEVIAHCTVCGKRPGDQFPGPPKPAGKKPWWS